MKRAIVIILALCFIAVFDSGNIIAQQRRGGVGATQSSRNKSSNPPVKKTNSYANAWILLPEDWNGTSILVKACEMVRCANCDTELKTKEIDKNFSKRKLSSNVKIQAGIQNNSDFSRQQMTVKEFVDYLHNKGYVDDGKKDIGIAAKVTYQNGIITEIVEVYTP